MFPLENKVVLITGAANEIGLTFAKELLRKKIKAIAVVDIDTSKGEREVNHLQKEFGTKSAIFVKADVSIQEQLKEAFEITIKAYNQLDIVINNAAIGVEQPLEKSVAVNLDSVIHCTILAMEEYIPKYKKGNEGVILNMSSIIGLYPMVQMPIYSATKAGVIAFSRSIALRYKKYQVKVITLCPGHTVENLQTTKEDCGVPKQTTAVLVAKGIQVLREAPNGSVWLIRNGSSNEVKFPDYADRL